MRLRFSHQPNNPQGQPAKDSRAVRHMVRLGELGLGRLAAVVDVAPSNQDQNTFALERYDRSHKLTWFPGGREAFIRRAKLQVLTWHRLPACVPHPKDAAACVHLTTKTLEGELALQKLERGLFQSARLSASISRMDSRTIGGPVGLNEFRG
jgi:hypothetical protein